MENDVDLDDPNSAFEPKRARVDLHLGAFYLCKGKVFRISAPNDVTSVIGTDINSGLSESLLIADLRPLTPDSLKSYKLANADPDPADPGWKIAMSRFMAISPLVNVATPRRKDVEEIANKHDVDLTTVYRWLKRYRAIRDISALIPQSRGWQKGRSRLNEGQLRIVNQVIRDFYLQNQRPSAQRTITEVQIRCLNAGVEPPGVTAIRNRIATIPQRHQYRLRGQKELAKSKYSATPGSFPGGEFPLDVVQIDHTPADIHIVDDETRKPIGKPWLTVAIDVHTRAIVGYYLSLDAPSETSVAMCVASIILPKDRLLREKGLDTQWQFHGIPRTIHVDNGAEFRSDTFTRSCQPYGIVVQYRPVKVPRYGGHIERLIGTLMGFTHELPGTSFSSVSEKGEYDSEKNAALTFAEYEKALLTYICKIYHRRPHSNLGMSPTEKWSRAVSSPVMNGIPLGPAQSVNPETVAIDFLPIYDRTIQNDGVSIDDIRYFDDALRPWVGATLPNDKSKKRKFAFRRDPRSINSIWFQDPNTKSYFRILASEQPFPPMSIWQWNQAKAAAKAKNQDINDVAAILHAHNEIDNQAREAINKTKRVRREIQRRRQHEGNRKSQEVAMRAPAAQLQAKQLPLDALINGRAEANEEIG